MELDEVCHSAAAADQGPLYFLREDPRTGFELGMAQNGKSHILQVFNPEFRDDTMGRPRRLEYGKLKAAMLLPPDYQPGHRYPTVFLVYGGEMGSRRINRFGLGDSGCDNMHLLASRGYIVVAPDIPIDKDPVADIVAAVEPALDAVIHQGYADPERMAVMGHSYGGYTVLALITHGHRFKAAIDRAGSANLVNEYLSFDNGQSSFLAYTETGQGNMHCTLWENPGRYVENSPVFALDKVTTPLLIVHGDQDNRAWVEESGQVFVGLR
ncbi:MAG TPA: prolyl oligopeptidase family serine peptidase, partial [Candidatus Xenobia bacterium]